ncbi:MAG TPA: hypothetical protein VI636_14900 [Candidatus Angelobacter sp.]
MLLRRRTSNFVGVLFLAITVQFVLAQQSAAPSAGKYKRTIKAQVVALEQPIWYNRLGAFLPGQMMYALKRDVVPKSNPNGPSCADSDTTCTPGNVMLRPDKRPRPMVLRANQGDLLQIEFTNYISNPANCPANTPPPPPLGQTCTRNAGVHVAGLELVKTIQDDSSFVGANSPSGLVAPGQTGTFNYFAKSQGNFLLYSFDDGTGNIGQWDTGLFGSVNVQPETAEWYRSEVTNKDLKNATFNKFHLPPNMKLSSPPAGSKTAVIEGVTHELCALTTDQPGAGNRHTTTTALVYVALLGGEPPSSACSTSGSPAKPGDGDIYTLSGHPVVNYDAVDKNGTPILSMLNPPHVLACEDSARGEKRPVVAASNTPCGTGEIVHTDLTAIITGPYADRFDYNTDGPEFHNVPASPDRRQPYREFSIFYHENNFIQQAFPDYYNNLDPNPAGGTLTTPLTTLTNTMANGSDAFAINYGTGGIGSEILANRLGKGPEADCVECKFEEFFLSSWVVGDPAMVVDNVSKPTYARFPDDPSNVYHSYLRDHVKFRIFNASPSQQHVHHQHAHQWLHTSNDDSSTYLDSQMIVPGAAYTLDMVYNGSGNRNGTIGDSIFHCHFYPHFAAGMWSLWRVHDVFEEGTLIQGQDKDTGHEPAGPPVSCSPQDNKCWNRALPDGELTAGSPIPAIVPIPTIGMAPKPARVKLVEHGRRAFVQPELTPSEPELMTGTFKYVKPQETVTYKNPGYPFFVPGIAGHRAPHPPMDFAVSKDKSGNPMTLDGGLPRHILLGGQFIREFHTIYDFSKDFSGHAVDQPKTEVLGKMIAEQLPEQGTPVEIAAMQSQSRRTVSTYSPDGLPGNFTLNGLPPISGAPFARPEVDDNGNVVSNTRRYQAAVIQRDVVLNRDGWHYPQQRFLTLWQDVNDTMSGKRPPEPLFFRINTGETVEFWHTNLVPSYYDLDNFQVRTPTDIIGQHIHLVKFDVLASDGAANGFNYEDGTFSPDEVRERIAVINNTGNNGKNGILAFSAACWDSPTALLPCLEKGARTPLTARTVAESNYPFTAPAGQNWDGAQTTVQRWDTDPLLNNQGRDRTMRTVFTHDHFGPSTHQNVGLYAGLVIEPDNSQWFDSETGAPMYTRTDGGPTSWQAVIKTGNETESYREFLLEYQDSQLAYTAGSPSAARTPTGLNPIFATNNDYSSVLNTNPDQCMQTTPANGNSCACTATTACCALQKNFCLNGVPLTDKATVSQTGASTWTIIDHFGTNNSPVDQYTLTTVSNNCPSGVATCQTVAINTMPSAWIDWAQSKNTAIAPQTKNLFNSAPSTQNGGVNVIDGAGIPPGTYSVNYRNEPVPLRVINPSNNHQPAGQTGDLSYAFVSGLTRADAKLNSQPDNGGFIGSSGFTFPQCPLMPTVGAGGSSCDPKLACPSGSGAGGCVQPTDPYTPMLRAFQGDRVQIRTLAGAHVMTHPEMVRGIKWFFEPSAENSGYRNAIDTGLSEHFEFLFRLPFNNVNSTVTNAADYLYQVSAGLHGTTNGMWGLMRAYNPSQPPVGLHKLPVPALPESTTAPQPCPATAPQKSFNVVAMSTQNLPNKGITYNSRSGAANIVDPNGLMYVLQQNQAAVQSGTLAAEPLILRVNAGDCVTIALQNNITKIPSGTAAQAPFYNKGIAIPNLTLQTSAEVGLSPQQVAYDVTQNAGFNVGFNPQQTVAQKNTGTFTWYAGNLFVRNGKTLGVPVELGTLNLLPSDPLAQDPWGLIGVLIVEPQNATVTVDGGTQASATVSRTITEADGTTRTETFREFVMVAEDDNIESSFNYRSEPLTGRIPNYSSCSSPCLLDITKGYSNSVLTGSGIPPFPPGLDPQTPVFWSPANTQVRLRVARPGQDDDLVFDAHGHVWQEEPYMEGSRVIGFNPLSNWLGTQQVGANDRYDLLIGRAGGTFNVSGDYEYEMLNHAQGGLWGVLRATPDQVIISNASLSGSTLNISGSVTKPVNGQSMATGVIISEVYDLLSPSGAPCPTSGMRPCVVQLGTATVQSNGSWSTSIPNVTLTNGAAIRVQSNITTPNLGGQATINVQ